MTDVVLSREIARQYTDGETRIVVEGGTMRAIVRQLDEKYPGLKGVLSEGMAVAMAENHPNDRHTCRREHPNLSQSLHRESDNPPIPQSALTVHHWCQIILDS